MFRLKLNGLLFIMLLGIISCSKMEQRKTDEEQEREVVLRNNIKGITEYKTSYSLDVPGKESISHEKSFNKKGFKVKEVLYKFEGSPEFIISHEYDDNGNLILSTSLGPDSSFRFKVIKTYDENKRRDSITFYLPDGTFKYRNIASYDNVGRMVKLTWYGPEGLRSINKFRYDDNKKMEDAEYGPDEKLRYSWIYKYDEKENLITATQYSPENTVNYKIEYKYNADNQLIKQIDYSGESIQTISKLEYDSKKLLSSKTEYSASGKIAVRYRYAYE